MKIADIASTVAMAAGGVILAGLVMSYLRGTVPLLAKAHTGFDS